MPNRRLMGCGGLRWLLPETRLPRLRPEGDELTRPNRAPPGTSNARAPQAPVTLTSGSPSAARASFSKFGEAAGKPYHLPVLGIDAHGSCLGRDSPFCSNSIDTLSGERT